MQFCICTYKILAILSQLSSIFYLGFRSNPALGEQCTDGKIRGVNLGGWLLLEPWITPNIFEEVSVGELKVRFFIIQSGYILEALPNGGIDKLTKIISNFRVRSLTSGPMPNTLTPLLPKTS